MTTKVKDAALPLQEPDAANAGNPSVPSVINMPDHEVRQKTWFQLFNRLARPFHDWLVAFGVGWAVLFGPIFKMPLGDGYLVQVLLYSGVTFGIRTAEKIKGVA